MVGLADHGPEDAQMAGLNVGGTGGSGSIFELAGKWLDLVKTGPYDSQFQYQPGSGATPYDELPWACSAGSICTPNAATP